MRHTFLIGALGYPALELIYRRRTHFSMAIAGGCAAQLINSIRKLPLRMPMKALLCGTAITGVEYLCGCIWNRNFSVWDYRRIPFNWKGQICLPYTLLWCTLSTAAMKAFDIIDKSQGRT